MDSQTVEGATFETDHRSWMRVTWTGEMTEASVQAMHAYARACRAERGDEGGGLLGIVLVGEGAGLDRRARRALTTSRQSKAWERLAIVGARFETRVLVELLTRALQALHRDVAELAFHETESEAITWLEAKGSG